MFQLKPLSKAAVPAALAKAERYRLLNEPGAAESICLDILRVDPDNQDALVMLVLALTDQFTGESSSRAVASVGDVLSRLTNEYTRNYYSGIVRERRGKAHLQQGRLVSAAAEWLREAMQFYERAEALREPGNEEALLRWNSCARLLMSIPVQPDVPEPEPLQLE
jgi:hypothetical protein